MTEQTTLIKPTDLSLPPFTISKNITADAKKLRTTYDITPNAPFYQKEFGFYCLDTWKDQGMTDETWKKFGYDGWASQSLGGNGWCEMEFHPCFDTVVIEDRGEYELVQDFAGRHVLYFKNRRNGFMPEYVDHPVKDFDTWEKNVKWRMQTNTPERIEALKKGVITAINAQNNGCRIVQAVGGGYMYLRSLMGPLELTYMFYDDPELIHACMKQWFEIIDAACAFNQQYLTYDEVFFAEDICYKTGSLISPDMIKEFLFPYYQQLIENCKKRQLDKSRKLFIQLDTDGFCDPVIPLYRQLGFNMFSPFEVASDCDVVRTGQQYPDIVISGGVDKRVLAQGPQAIDNMIKNVFEPMYKRGGFIPTCDHGVPEEVSLENYLYFRKRALEFSK